MKNISRILVLAGASAVLSIPLMAQVTMAPLTSFRGDGWFAPLEDGYTFLGTGNLERGIAYNPVTDRLYLVSRNGGTSVRILNPVTGEDLGGLDTGGISGGTFPLNMIAVASDGAIYGANLVTPISDTAIFRVYKWENETAFPNLVFGGNTLDTGRVGDNFDLIGSGANTRLVAGYAPAGTSTPPGTNSYVIIDPTAGTFKNISLPTPPNNGDFRLGVTFVDEDTVIGAAGGVNPFRVTDFSLETGVGTLVASPTAASAMERPMDFAMVAGVPLLATVETGGTATGTGNTVRIYDFTDPANPVVLASSRITSGDVVTNSNGVGSVKWGAISGNSAVLYAMNTNNGIQAFTVTIPEPSSVAALIFGIGALGLRRFRYSS
jgi:hypothetical protein